MNYEQAYRDLILVTVCLFFEQQLSTACLSVE